MKAYKKNHISQNQAKIFTENCDFFNKSFFHMVFLELTWRK